MGTARLRAPGALPFHQRRFETPQAILAPNRTLCLNSPVAARNQDPGPCTQHCNCGIFPSSNSFTGARCCCCSARTSPDRALEKRCACGTHPRLAAVTSKLRQQCRTASPGSASRRCCAANSAVRGWLVAHWPQPMFLVTSMTKLSLPRILCPLVETLQPTQQKGGRPGSSPVELLDSRIPRNISRPTRCGPRPGRHGTDAGERRFKPENAIRALDGRLWPPCPGENGEAATTGQVLHRVPVRCHLPGALCGTLCD